MEAAAKELFVVRMVFNDRGELQVAPAAALDFDVVFAPTDVGFVGPALLIELAEDFGDKFEAVDVAFGPVLDFAERVIALAQGKGIEGVLGGQRDGAHEQTASVARPTAKDGLEEEERGHQRARPPTSFFPRQGSLGPGGSADANREKQTGNR